MGEFSTPSIIMHLLSLENLRIRVLITQLTGWNAQAEYNSQRKMNATLPKRMILEVTLLMPAKIAMTACGNLISMSKGLLPRLLLYNSSLRSMILGKGASLPKTKWDKPWRKTFLRIILQVSCQTVLSFPRESITPMRSLLNSIERKLQQSSFPNVHLTITQLIRTCKAW